LLPSDFGNAEHANRSWGVLFLIGTSKLSVENVIRTEMYDRRLKILGGECKVPNRGCIHRKAAFRVVFTFVHWMVNRTIDDDVRVIPGKVFSHCGRLGDVQFRPTERHHVLLGISKDFR
jgi:hypothetical protein